jgi:hypothetical protein
MLNAIKVTPKILGPIQLPEIHRRRSLIGKQVMLQLPDLQEGYALELEFGDFEDLRIGRKQILQACGVVYGWGRVKTASDRNHLFVWLIPQEIDFSKKVRTNRFGNMPDKVSPLVQQIRQKREASNV